MSTLTTSIQHFKEVRASKTRQEKEVKCVLIGKNKTVLAANLMADVYNLIKSMKNILEMESEFSKVIEYKVFKLNVSLY